MVKKQVRILPEPLLTDDLKRDGNQRVGRRRTDAEPLFLWGDLRMTTFLITADIVLPGLVLWLAAWLFYPRGRA